MDTSEEAVRERLLARRTMGLGSGLKTELGREVIERAITAILFVIEDPVDVDAELRDGLKDTPKRVAKAFAEMFEGYSQDPAEILKATFGDGDDEQMFEGMVIVKDIPFFSQCEHHMVPFFGTADVAYIPEKKVVGLSKIARLVDCFAKRLQIQERMTWQIANSIQEILAPKGVMVVLEAEHLCMGCRGVKKPGSRTTTSSITGVFKSNQAAREEFLMLRNGR